MVAIKSWQGKKLTNTRISNTTHIGNPENLNLNDHIFIGPYNMIDASNSITIGEGCHIASFISIITHSSHVAIRLYGAHYGSEKTRAYFRGSLEIGKYTFVGPNAVLMPGTKIGKGSLVSAFSYVKGAFEDFSIIAGNPAKRVGDTRELDKKYLAENPDLQKFYDQWAS